MAKKTEKKKMRFDTEVAKNALESQISAARTQLGTNRINLAADHERRIFGLGPPSGVCSIPLGFLIGTPIWPMQRIHQVSGEPMSLKSCECFEYLLWMLKLGGKAVLIDTEKKVSPIMLRAQFGESLENLFHEEVDFMEEAQERCKYHIDLAIENYKKGIILPTAICIDSVVGANLKNVDKEIRSEGHAAERSWGGAAAANSMTNWLKSATSWITGAPIIIFFVNHDKVDPTAFSPNPNVKIKKQPGGSAVKFHCTNQLSNSVMSNSAPLTRYSKSDTDGIDARCVDIKVIKCGMGPDNRRVQVPIRWKYDENGQQQLWWDWNMAAPFVLKNVQEDAKYKFFAKRLEDVLHLDVKSNRWTSSTLGLDQVLPEEVGEALAVPENDGILRQVEAALGIVRYPRIEEYEFS